MIPRHLKTYSNQQPKSITSLTLKQVRPFELHWGCEIIHTHMFGKEFFLTYEEKKKTTSLQ